MTTPTNEEVRRQFEAWARTYCLHIGRDSDGYYSGMETQAPWVAWQAALRSPAVAGLVEAANAVADFTPEAQREKWSCHYGITTAAKCGRCSREMRLAAALAPFTTGAGHE